MSWDTPAGGESSVHHPHTLAIYLQGDGYELVACRCLTQSLNSLTSTLLTGADSWGPSATDDAWGTADGGATNGFAAESGGDGFGGGGFGADGEMGGGDSENVECRKSVTKTTSMEWSSADRPATAATKPAISLANVLNPGR